MSTAQEPSKTDIDAILKRLRSIATNKSCFDCGAKNPTWSSVTYGVFICIDCSATHRSLGVHLSFVRSTQLDTNWTWIQLRQMQLGGNANATAFFEQHNCTSKDAQQKYNSRAAQLYREKLHQSATKAQRTYGNKVHIDDGHKETTTKQDTDFFQEHTSSNNNGNQLFNTNFDSNLSEHIVDKSHEGPSVNAAALIGNNESASLSSTTGTGTSSDEVKSTILQKKPAQNKKKGLGAQKVQTDFKELERATQEMDKMKELEIQEQAKSKEEAEKQMQKQMASMKLAYDNLDKQREKEEAKLKQVDPKKAEQLERLGMAVGNRNSGISHSALSDMQIIQQEGVYSSKPLTRQKDFFDEFESSFKTSSSNRGYNDENMDFRGFGSSATSSNSYKLDSDWVNVDEKYDKFDDNYLADKKSTNNYNKSSSNSNNDYSSTSNNGDATKRFANAKSISSDQYFGNRNSDSEQRNLSRFENSTSISSDDYFGNSSSNKYKSGSSSSSSAGPDLSMLKQDLKDGVSKAAGKLSNMASNLMTSLQDKL